LVSVCACAHVSGLVLIGLGDDSVAWGIALIVMVPLLTIILASGTVVQLLNRHEGRKDAIISRLREQRPGTDGMKEACSAAFQYFDVDRSGYMNFQEMIEFMEELHPGDAAPARRSISASALSLLLRMCPAAGDARTPT
jgi:hypothetical protein